MIIVCFTVLYMAILLPMDTKCLTCKRAVLPHAKQIRCVICLALRHVKSLSSNTKEQICILSCSSSWYCINCISEALPFNNIIDDEEFKDALFCKEQTDYYLNHETVMNLTVFHFLMKWILISISITKYSNIWQLIVAISTKKNSMMKQSYKNHYWHATSQFSI